MFRPVNHRRMIRLVIVLSAIFFSVRLLPAQSQEPSVLVIPAGDSAALVRALEQANEAGIETPLNIYLQAGQYILYASNEVDKPVLPLITGAVNLYGQNTLLLLYSETASPAQMIIAQGARVELHHLHLLLASGTARAVINHGTLHVYDSNFGSLDRELLPGIGEGGGIENHGELSIERTTFARNQYLSTNTEGGAIYNAGSLSATCARFVEGLASRGGAIFNTGNATITNSAFVGNTANGGGAIFSAEGTVDASHNWWNGFTPSVNDLYLGTDTISTGVGAESALPSDPTQDGTCEVQPPVAIPDEIPSSPAPSAPQTYTVTTTADSGAGSLRQAILDANATTDTDTITFNIPAGSCPGGVCTITPTSDLPIITSPVTLDGTTQTGASCPTTPRIQIQGSASRAYGLRLNNLASGSLIKGLIIGGFSSSGTVPRGTGIFLDNADNVKIQCSFIGVNAAGTAANSNQIGIGLGSDTSGAIIGTDSDGLNDDQERNLISGNLRTQIYIGFMGTANNNRIAGNYIGINAVGTAAISPSATQGIYINSGTNNRIGVFADGISDALEGNVISGNGVGIQLHYADNRVSGNIIGLNALKTSAVPNNTGIDVSGSIGYTLIGTDGDGVGDSLEGNLISGNTQYGIYLGGSNNRVAGNMIGLNGAGTDFIGNGTGILVSGFNNTIGTAETYNLLHANLIAGNLKDGIQVNGGTNNRISMNQIYQNGTLATHLGIDLIGIDGVNPNDVGDADTGPNRLVNYPIISSVSTNLATQVTINASISSSPSTTFRVEVYSNPTCDPSGNGEGRTYRTGFTVTTNASGVTPANVTLDIPPGEPYFTLIAIQMSGAGYGDTSEFSPCATFLPSAYTVTTTADSGAGSLRQAILDTNATTDTDTITFNIPAGSCPGGVCTITPTSDLPIITSPVTLDGTTQTGASCPTTPRIQIQGSAAGAYGLRLNNLASGSLIKGLIIGGFSSSATAPGARGIFLDNADNVKIQCSFIGVNAAGTAANSNRIGIGLESGVSGAIIGTDGDGVNDDQERNLISGNILAQIYIGFTGTANSSNRIAGNYIGINGAGTAAISPAATSGIFLFAGVSNLIGTNGDGISDTLEANLISGNGVGIELRSANNRVSGNIIGLNALKTSAVPNTTGVYVNSAGNAIIGTNVDGVGDALEGNLISGNTQYGIRLLSANNNRMAGNVIGLNGAGTGFIGNGTGIFIDLSNNNIIGADTNFNPLHRNVIAGNTADGVQVNSSSTNNRISMNRIYQNGTLPTHLGIDLTSTDGVNLNDEGDADTGPNRLVNYPIINSVSTNLSTQVTINASLSSSANTTFRVEVYSSPVCDPSGNGEGRSFRAGFTVTTNTSGVTPANVTVDIPSDEPYFTLIAIQASGAGVGDTSEFSPCATFIGSSYEVTSTSDTGVGSLRQALLDANSNTDYSRITFNIPTADSGCVDGVCTIVLSTALPQINTLMILDGTTQSDASCPDAPRIAIRRDGHYSGLHLNADASGSQIKGLVLYGLNSNPAIWLDHSSHNTLICNFVGIMPDGVTWPGGGNGIEITNGTHNRIGTNGDGIDDLSERNLIGGTAAVLITGSGSIYNRVSGNYLNMEINGIHALLNPYHFSPSGFAGVVIVDGASYNLVGTDGIGVDNYVERNLIAARHGNTGLMSGVAIDQAHHNTIAGNYIGTNKAGNAPSLDISLGDYYTPFAGIWVTNGSTHNLIGTNSDNQGDVDERNVIAGYASNQIWIGDDPDSDTLTQHNRVSGNYVGIDAAGTAAVVGDNLILGILIGPRASHNVVGTNGDGINDPGERNVIAGNTICDVCVVGDENRVSGNYIGVNAAGNAVITTTVPYIFHVLVGDEQSYQISPASRNIIGTNGDGISDELEGNLISGISPIAIRIAATGSTDNRIAGNIIGLGADGSTILSPTTGIYIELNAQNTLIGSNNDGVSDDLEGNVITAQTNAGVRILSTAGVGNRLSRNRIYGVNALGIDLNDDGVTPNDEDDGDSGPNNLQNTPILTAALNGGETVTGTLNSTPNRAFRLEFFANESCAEAAYKAGKTYIGTLEVTTDANGDVTFSAGGLNIVFDLQSITATATDMLTGDTSEFSGCAAAAESIYSVTTTADSGVGSLRQAISNANSAPNVTSITFNIPASDPGCVDGVCTIALSTALPQITTPVNIDGTTQSGASCPDAPKVVITLGYPYSGDLEALYLNSAASGSTIRGLVIQHIRGIWLDGSHHNTITCNLIGVSPDGMSWYGTTIGVYITNGAHNRIGTDGDGVDDPAERNLISAEEAVSITGPVSTFNRVSGNYLNMKIDGDHIIYETPPSGYSGCFSGVRLTDGASYNLIGVDGISIDNPVERNLIAAYYGRSYENYCYASTIGGIGIELDNADHNTIAGNYIGANRAGDATSGGVLPQGSSFIYFYSVSINNGSSYNVIGTNGDGQGDIAERNLLAGDAAAHIAVYGTGSDYNTVAGNYIGVNATGTEVISKAAEGVQTGPFTAYNVIGTNGDGNNDALEGNVIAGHWSSNLLVTGSYQRISGNYIGVNAAGTALLLPIGGNPAYVEFDLSIGYEDDGNQDSPATNIIFGTNGDGISDDLEGNLVGSAVPITLRVSEMGSSGNIIAGNLFGVGADKTTIIAPSTLIQIDTSAHNTLIGSNNDGVSDDLEGNIIAAQANAGIKILSNGSVGNRLSRNRIYGVNAVGIDLNDDGVTPNDTGDGDSGPNNLQNTPILTGVLNDGETVTGTLNSTPNRAFRLEFFANESCAEAAYKAGKTYIGTLEVTTDANGDVTFSAGGLAVIFDPPAITATATDTVTGDTSEFSICVTNILPGAVTQVSPSGNITSRTPTFTWNAAPGAQSYGIAVVKGGSQLVHQAWYNQSEVCTGNSCSVTPALDLDADNYDWYIGASNTAGEGPWSYQGFRVNILPPMVTQISPSGSISSRSPVFTWNSHRDALWYGVVLVKGGSQVIFQEWRTRAEICNDNTCTLSLPLDLDADNYDWYIGAYNPSGEGPWTYQGFRVNILPPMVTQTGPSGSISSRSPVFTWNSHRDALWYGVVLVKGGSQVIFEQWRTRAEICTGTTCTLSIPLDLDADNYDWYIGAYNPSGEGPWTYQGFQVSLVPGATTLISPSGVIGGNQPTLTWGRNRDAIFYGIYVYSVTGGATILQEWRPSSEVCSGNTCTRPLPAALPSGDYRWYVGGIGVAGEGPWLHLDFTVQ